jgi:PAS domain S-box-containing protein
LDFYPPREHEIIQSYFQRTMDGEDILADVKIRRKDGTEIDTEFKDTQIWINGSLHVHASVLDVTERKRLESELKKSIALLENIHACSDEAVLVVDSTTRVIISANEAAGNIFGYQAREMIGRNTDFLHVSDEACQEVGRLLTSSMAAGEILRGEFSMRKKNGSVFTAENTIKTVQDDSGRSVMCVRVVRDITEQEKAIVTLENREKDLKEKSLHLEELNIALKVLLDDREKEKKKIGEGFSNRISERIVPYLERIRKTGLDELQMEYINILESNLREIVRPYKTRMSDKLTRLSPSETRIVNYLRQGHGSKEIASMLNLSPRTVEFHRDNIRKKLGLKNRKVNLQTYLADHP